MSERVRARKSAVTAALLTTLLGVLTAVVATADPLPGEWWLMRAAVVDPDGSAAFWWQVVSDATGTAPLLAVLAVGVAVLVTARQLASAAYLVAAGGGTALLSLLLKRVVGRERPDVVALAGDLSPSYPSGHAAVSAAVLGAAAAVLVTRTPPRQRQVVLAVAVVLLALVAASQLALGRHHPSDLVAGWLLAGAWLAAVSSLRPRPSQAPARPAAARG